VGEIRFDERLHMQGEECPIEDTSISNALAWWVAAELLRRHPGALQVIETHPGGGQYNCVSVYRSPLSSPSSALVDMNVDPGTHLTHASWFDRMGERFNWLEVLLAADRREYVVEQLERVEGLTVPPRTPSTTEQSIGALVIASFLERSILGPSHWTAANAVGDGEYGANPRTDLLEALPELREEYGAAASEPGIESLYGVWFVGSASGGGPFAMDQPAFAVDLAGGRLWKPGGGSSIDLMAKYQSVDRSLDALVSAVCPPAF